MTHPDMGRYYARRAVPELGWCERCLLRPAVERHHRNSDTFDNRRSNLWLLCRRCHQEVDGRLAALITNGGIVKAHAKRAAQMRAQTQCKRGHPFNIANTYIAPSGSRVCRACQALFQHNYRERRKR